MELNRAAEQSGISLGRLSGYAKNGYLVRGGCGKGTHYRLNSEGLALAKQIMAAVLEQAESTALRTADTTSFTVPQPPVFGNTG